MQLGLPIRLAADYIGAKLTLDKIYANNGVRNLHYKCTTVYITSICCALSPADPVADLHLKSTRENTGDSIDTK